MNCSICKKQIDTTPIWDGGHNAQPINNGRCCTNCNNTIVIPKRLEQYKNEVQK